MARFTASSKVTGSEAPRRAESTTSGAGASMGELAGGRAGRTGKLGAGRRRQGQEGEEQDGSHGVAFRIRSEPVRPRRAPPSKRASSV